MNSSIYRTSFTALITNQEALADVTIDPVPSTPQHPNIEHVQANTTNQDTPLNATIDSATSTPQFAEEVEVNNTNQQAPPFTLVNQVHITSQQPNPKDIIVMPRIITSNEKSDKSDDRQPSDVLLEFFNNLSTEVSIENDGLFGLTPQPSTPIEDNRDASSDQIDLASQRTEDENADNNQSPESSKNEKRLPPPTDRKLRSSISPTDP